jgi:hypothetical protein
MAAGWARIVVAGTLVIGGGTPASGQDSNAPVRCPAAAVMPDQIRTTSCVMMQAIAIGMSASPTFRALVERMADLRGIVYLSATPILRTKSRRVIDGALQHRVTVAGPYRLLFVTVTPYSGLRPIGIIAHELQHAVEVLESGATTEQEIERLFERIGIRAGVRIMETTAALEIQHTVTDELVIARRRSAGR